MAKKAASTEFNKAGVIREALKKGIESPSKIAAYSEQTYGKKIDPKYVSVIKSQIRAKEHGKSTGGARGIRRDTLKEASMFALKCGSIEKAKKALDGIRSDATLAFAVSQGGVDRAISALDSLASQLS